MSKIKTPKKKASVLEEILVKLFSKLYAIERLTDTIYKLTDKKGKCGLFVVKVGKIVLPIESNSISVLVGDYLLVENEKKLGIFSGQIPALVLTVDNDRVAFKDAGLYTITKGEKTGTFRIGINQLTWE